ncbi:MAG TPA: hypothetical protein VII75_15450 [Thermoanaerobaculia bacterium]|nr:hypothetical protein [Thermoanaerobaculia bacterium]
MPDPSASKPGEDAWSNAKTAQYALRYADEVRAKKAVEAQRATLHTQKFKDALASLSARELAVYWDRFTTAGGASFVALHLSLPSDSVKPGSKVTVFGDVRDEKGGGLTSFEETSVVQLSKDDLFIERVLFFNPVKATGSFGVAVGRDVAAVGKATIEIPADLSDLIVSNDVYNLTVAQTPFDTFAFGGTKVVPKPALRFHANDEVWLFTEYHDAMTGAPSLSMRTTIDGNGKKIAGKWQPVQPSPLKGVPGHYGVGTTVDLSALAPGDYKIEFAVSDGTKTWVRTKNIFVRP